MRGPAAASRGRHRRRIKLREALEKKLNELQTQPPAAAPQPAVPTPKPFAGGFSLYTTLKETEEKKKEASPPAPAARRPTGASSQSPRRAAHAAGTMDASTRGQAVTRPCATGGARTSSPAGPPCVNGGGSARSPASASRGATCSYCLAAGRPEKH